MNRHHVNPRSRDKRKNKDHNNVVMWDESFHDLFHQLFDNMTIPEIYEFIAVVTQPGTSWDHKDLTRLKQEIKGE